MGRLQGAERWAYPHVGRRSDPKIANLPGSWELLNRKWTAKRDNIAARQRLFFLSLFFLLLRNRRRKEGFKMASSCLLFFWLTPPWLFFSYLIISDSMRPVLLPFKIKKKGIRRAHQHRCERVAASALWKTHFLPKIYSLFPRDDWIFQSSVNRHMSDRVHPLPSYPSTSLLPLDILASRVTIGPHYSDSSVTTYYTDWKPVCAL